MKPKPLDLSKSVFIEHLTELQQKELFEHINSAAEGFEKEIRSKPDLFQTEKNRMCKLVNKWLRGDK